MSPASQNPSVLELSAFHQQQGRGAISRTRPGARLPPPPDSGQAACAQLGYLKKMICEEEVTMVVESRGRKILKGVRALHRTAILLPPEREALGDMQAE